MGPSRQTAPLNPHQYPYVSLDLLSAAHLDGERRRSAQRGSSVVLAFTSSAIRRDDGYDSVPIVAAMQLTWQALRSHERPFRGSRGPIMCWLTGGRFFWHSDEHPSSSRLPEDSHGEHGQDGRVPQVI